ncbi:MAG TPA: circularly permuted type 2 ATP-grasp protein [Actinomycetota bacterium]|nr:circularly permuted type 2 ATP-grasp protein [Actinomycetota bacterium]
MAAVDSIRPPYQEMDGEQADAQAVGALKTVLDGLGEEGLAERGRLVDAYFNRQGITFNLAGRERPLPLDLVPRLLSAAEWRVIEQGVAQRIKALEMFLADIYGPGLVLEDGVVPRRLVTSSAHFHREAWGIEPPNGVRIHVAGIDLIRDEEGVFAVLEDNLRCPSGVSYVLENRRALAHVLPELFTDQLVQPVAEYPERLLDALLAAAPAGVADPQVAVLTPGVHNSAHFEHAFLARRMGVELVEGRDLYCRDDQVWMRTVRGPAPVHVLYRRIDDDYLDPVHFRPESVLGVPGLLSAARAGRVTVANAVGNGVADDKAVYPYVPDLIEYYLGEQAILPNIDTYDLQDADQRRFVLERLDRMVLKPVDGSGGYGLVVGDQATDAQLDQLARRVEADPRSWIAQRIVRLSTCPTVVDGGELAARHVDLRPFAVNDGDNVFVLPGGLTRVALPEGSLVVNSSQGGGSKDTWVVAEPDESPPYRPPDRPTPRLTRVLAAVPARIHSPAGHDERMRQQENQQQQAGGECPC